MTGPRRYRARPVEVLAIEYTTANLPDLRAWLAAELDPGDYQFSPDGSHLVIYTFEGDSRDCGIDDGYWIVQGVIGEFYPVRAEPFAIKYEEA